MEIAIQNVSSTSAIVTWSSTVNCAENFYSIMYHPNWNTLLSGYPRKNFQKEEKVPISQNWLAIEKLTPLTMYILCITCQPANPTNEQCTIFSTAPQNAAAVTSRKKDLALGIWLTSSILLLIIAGILLYGCLHIWCCKRREHPEGLSMSSDHAGTQAWKTQVMETALEDNLDMPCNVILSADSRTRENSQLNAITENPFTSKNALPLRTQAEKLSASSSNENNG
ncbi:fibronectin type III domain-containing protein 9 [Chiloscyllium plagiosum]|uniref:fibronectin type III domain-containing protein 9 n=1 Tax=Chiloscyllium plagiosum TaxID=36176 RepID=UPI001CB8439D|nr:fibronectin type III domain-containing protein 9 [Chiloscyllium plagiosum]